MTFALMVLPPGAHELAIAMAMILLGLCSLSVAVLAGAVPSEAR